MTSNIAVDVFVVLAGAVLLYRLWVRLALSRAKHPSLRGHARWSRRMARLLSQFDYSGERFFSSDLAPPDVAARRRDGFERLRQQIAGASPQSLHYSQSLEDSISDVRFTSNYRVPFPYRRDLPREFRFGTMAQETRGRQVCDLDGVWRYDLAGSYGVNVFGYDFYKQCLEAGFARAQELGPVLGPYHPVIRDNVEALKKISGLDEVSFHMSGTEAVMQAVRLARYHTGRTHLVRLCGAYHGWWDGVQPGVGNTRKVDDVYTLADLSERTLHVLETRNDIACVLINPFQALHPNSDAPGDSALVASDRGTAFDRARYSKWLQRIREVCTRRGVVLIFDEVFAGFRLGHRGAQEYFGVQADLVTYGKTLGGGLPIGVVCGTHALMKRYRDEQPANISFARGTFNSHPYVMTCMHEFLTRIAQPDVQQIYAEADACWNRRVQQLNDMLGAAQLPVRLSNMHSILSVQYTQPCRYNWMLQFYLRAEGLELSWTGTGRLIMSLDYTDADFAEVAQRLVHGAAQMQRDGWWWSAPHLTNKWIKRQMFKDMLAARFAGRGRGQPASMAEAGRTPGGTLEEVA
ncbi:MAG TPA: aminotransferase class III-fold pyridoxal phosphate-dependent enzyme [Nevskiaceae bacterium]|nr:aminotransferase class III-fold pyridoxal phosphate-dependent enzyme [Nevskiaceae bacterium]